MNQTSIQPCARKHCNHRATVFPIIRVPARDCCLRPDSDLSSGPLRIALCGHHFMTMNPGELLSKKLQGVILRRCKTDKHGARPDFARAYKESIAIPAEDV